MTVMDYLKIMSEVVKDLVPVITCGVFTLALLSCALFFIQTYFSLTQGFLSVGAAVFQSGHIHRLFVFPVYHRSLAQLLLNITALVFLCGSLEKGVGTVRFLSVFLLLSTTTGLCYSFLDLLLQGDSSQTHTEGLVPVALACVALTTMHTKVTKGFLCGVSFPAMALPWVFLILATALFPHCVLPCNVIAILVGWMYGKGWFSLLEVSEARAGVVEKLMPFRLLRSICGVLFVPASAEERRKTLLPQINPTPGSYPVQAYAPISSIKPAATVTYEGWPNSKSALSGPTPPLHSHGHGPTHNLGLSHGHSCNHSHHAHSHGQL
ncbi:rhomboid domain-containing protein 2 [Hippoglossus stenolepis]|uniref:rhomboid domain-containing protein 2 n=1 Tax=Hippoglossus stenolepis TaxID=195615 RepID=UPI00159C7A40|nr:rhomboid domain-containing protein 2 [Hippoglossus stenolepis]